MSFRKSILAAGLVLSASLLSGCAPEFNPPPGYVGGFLWNNNKSRTVVVQPFPGDPHGLEREAPEGGEGRDLPPVPATVRLAHPDHLPSPAC